MTDGSIDDTHRDLDPSLEPHFASLLSRHKEAVAKTEWSYQQFLPPEIEECRAYLATRGVFLLSDYLDEVVQPLWSYWGLDRRVSQSEETRKAHAQLRRYRAALRKFARGEARPTADVGALPAGP